MNLSKKQYDVLVMLAETKTQLSQREIAEKAKFSVGMANKTVRELEDAGYAENGKITEKGLAALEPYKVKRAIIIAAGFGSRLVPITLNTPKPLVRVKGKRIIDSVLDAVVAAGINDIVIVRGYLGEQFDQLLYKYPMIKFVENPIYNEANNISSVYCVKDYIQNAYIIEADLLVYNPSLITKYQYSSNYLGVKTERTDDWCFHVENGFIKKLSVGGLDCYHTYGISYWTGDDGKRLAKHLDEEFHAPGGKELYWDEVALSRHINEYDIRVRECSFDDIIEIDTFGELKKLDPTYGV